MNNKQELTKYLHLIIKIGVGVLTSILTGFIAGLLIDRKFQLNGLAVLVGVIIGVAIGFIWLYNEVMKVGKETIDE
ncbi:MAG: AtpZ/AtpI family protein [Candidatus Margulisiibacteriota bacterium]